MEEHRREIQRLTEEHLREKEEALEELRREHKKSLADYMIARDDADEKSGKLSEGNEVPMIVAYMV